MRQVTRRTTAVCVNSMKKIGIDNSIDIFISVFLTTPVHIHIDKLKWSLASPV